MGHIGPNRMFQLWKAEQTKGEIWTEIWAVSKTAKAGMVNVSASQMQCSM